MTKNKASCRKCRIEGKKLFLKGEKCLSPKCPLTRRNYGPGQHGMARKRVSEFGLQLKEKQKAKRIYGLREVQFRNYFKKASKLKGVLGENLLMLLETRLDSIVYRAGFAVSRSQARQLVNHGHFLVNGKSVNIPSFKVKEGSEISLKDKSKKMSYFTEVAKKLAKEKVPSWLKLDAKNLKVKVISWPKLEDLPAEINTALIVEFYSR